MLMSIRNLGLAGPEFPHGPARTFRTGNRACHYGISLFTMLWGVLNGKLLSGMGVAPMPCQEMSMNTLSLKGS